MTVPAPRTTASRPPGALRIGELAARAGVAVSTIKFYIREGLVPPPVKTARTSGYYGDAHLARLGLIRKLRDEHFLPVRVIKAVLAERGDEPLTAAEAVQLARIAPALERQVAGGAALTRAEACVEYRCTEDELQIMAEMGLVDGGERLSGADLALLDALRTAEAGGLGRQLFPTEGLGH